MNLKKRLIGDKGQVTIFIIIAILVVGLVVLIYFLFPGLRSNVQTGTTSPSEYIDTCMREKIVETIETSSMNGGVYFPREEESYLYEGDYIKYHCYTNEYFKSCVVQHPLLTSKFENEVKKEIESDSRACFDSMLESFRDRGYEVSLEKQVDNRSINVDVLPGRTIVRYNNKFTAIKSESEEYENFQIVIENNLYQIFGIATSIVEWEEEYGDAPTSTYMDWYHNLKIEKKLQLDGTTIYIMTDRDKGDVFRFASRSLVLPPGY